MHDNKDQPSESGTDQPSPIMAECPNCGYRFIGADLVGSPCPTCGERSGQAYCLRARPQTKEPVVEVYRTSNWFEAELIRERLLADGIVAAFAGNAGCGWFIISTDGVSQTSLMALESEAAQARRLVERYLEQIGSEDEPSST